MNDEDYHSPGSVSSYLEPRLAADLISIDDENNQRIDDADDYIGTTKNRGKNKIYEKFGEFESVKIETEHLNKLGWIKSKLIKDKLKFRCKRECPKSLYCQILNDQVIAFESIGDHKHLNKDWFLPKKSLAIVEYCLDKSQFKPSKILMMKYAEIVLKNILNLLKEI